MGFPPRLVGGRLLTASAVNTDYDRFLLKSWPVEGGEPSELGYWDAPTATWGDVDPTGKWLAFFEGRSVFVIPVDQVETVSPRKIGTHDQGITRLAFGPDGVQLATEPAKVCRSTGSL